MDMEGGEWEKVEEGSTGGGRRCEGRLAGGGGKARWAEEV